MKMHHIKKNIYMPNCSFKAFKQKKMFAVKYLKARLGCFYAIVREKL